MISIDPSKPLHHEQGDEHGKIDHIQQLQSTVSLNDTKPETLSTEFSHNLSEHVMIETTTRFFGGKNEERDSGDTDETDEHNKIDHVDEVDVSDSIEDDQKQTLSYPNETLEKGQESDESEAETEKSSSGGKLNTLSIDNQSDNFI